MTTLRTDDREVTLESDPIMAAGGLRMMARHLAATIDVATAHPDRLREVADDAAALIIDAVKLTGEDQNDRKVWLRVADLRYHADRTECGLPRQPDRHAHGRADLCLVPS